MKTYLHLDSVRHLSINQFALWASAIGATIIVGVLALLAANLPSSDKPASVSITTASSVERQEDLKEQWLARYNTVAPEISPMQDRKEELAFLAARAHAKAMIERQEDLKEQWLARYNSVTPEISPMQDRKEELAFLAARTNAKAIAERQEALKEQWLAQRSLTNNSFITNIMRQEELKDNWLQHR